MRLSGPLAERLALMVITDPAARIGTREAAVAALRGGAPAIQLRWKEGTTRGLLELARFLRERTRESGALLIVNDRVDVALAAGADGAHLGDDDLPLEVARQIAPPGFLLGKSVDSAEEGQGAAAAGADYLGIGPVFPTSTKGDAGAIVGLDGIRELRAAVRLPFVGIGGIDENAVAEVIRAGADGVAVIGSVMGAHEPQAATAGLLREIRRGLAFRQGRPA